MLRDQAQDVIPDLVGCGAFPWQIVDPLQNISLHWLVFPHHFQQEKSNKKREVSIQS
jgi:hypothetical protein